MSYKRQVITENVTDIMVPKQYAVILHNDDFTTMDFVVDVLVRIFHKTEQEAANIMMDVHKSGTGTAGTYTYDIARSKKIQTELLAVQHGFPLWLTLEEVKVS